MQIIPPEHDGQAPRSINFAATPDSNAPISFEVLMEITGGGERRVRASRNRAYAYDRYFCRMITLTPSEAPAAIAAQKREAAATAIDPERDHPESENEAPPLRSSHRPVWTARTAAMLGLREIQPRPHGRCPPLNSQSHVAPPPKRSEKIGNSAIASPNSTATMSSDIADKIRGCDQMNLNPARMRMNVMARVADSIRCG